MHPELAIQRRATSRKEIHHGDTEAQRGGRGEGRSARKIPLPMGEEGRDLSRPGVGPYSARLRANMEFFQDAIILNSISSVGPHRKEIHQEHAAGEKVERRSAQKSLSRWERRVAIYRDRSGLFSASSREYGILSRLGTSRRMRCILNSQSSVGPHRGKRFTTETRRHGEERGGSGSLLIQEFLEARRTRRESSRCRRGPSRRP